VGFGGSRRTPWRFIAPMLRGAVCARRSSALTERSATASSASPIAVPIAHAATIAPVGVARSKNSRPAGMAQTSANPSAISARPDRGVGNQDAEEQRVPGIPERDRRRPGHRQDRVKDRERVRDRDRPVRTARRLLPPRPPLAQPPLRLGRRQAGARRGSPRPAGTPLTAATGSSGRSSAPGARHAAARRAPSAMNSSTRKNPSLSSRPTT
jgi:hypothetical protein